MKLRALFGVLSLSLASLMAYGQNYSNEFSASCGIMSSTQLNDDAIIGRGFLGYEHVSLSGNTGSLFLTYRHFFSPGFAIGLAGGIQSYDIHPGYSSTDYFSATIFTLAAEAKVIYLSRNDLQLYGLLGTGVRSYHMSHSSVYYYLSTDVYSEAALTGQLTPIGISYNVYEKRLAIFAEAGYGYKGVANFGFTYRFGKTGKFLNAAGK
jgi:hypothetical protein